MVLNVLMRWPALIVVCALAGVGAIVYNEVDGDEVIYSMKQLAVEAGMIKADQLAKAAKEVQVIPAAQAQTIQVQAASAPASAASK